MERESPGARLPRLPLIACGKAIPMTTNSKVQRSRGARNVDSDELTIPIAIPRSALTIVAAPPEMISQRTAREVLGIDRRPFLEALPAFRASGGAVLELGRLRLVHRVAFVVWLETRSMASSLEEADGANAFVSELGLRLVGGRRG